MADGNFSIVVDYDKQGPAVQKAIIVTGSQHTVAIKPDSSVSAQNTNAAIKKKFTILICNLFLHRLSLMVKPPTSTVLSRLDLSPLKRKETGLLSPEIKAWRSDVIPSTMSVLLRSTDSITEKLEVCSVNSILKPSTTWALPRER